ncbi:TlyA family RNA methyltransferase [Desulforhabdus amnigena]|jgi:23S rRNA (cytidine1920-2'-O)/16S rRNA (cytidine1409-2'-O)-methyltransferase|uniref:TlyA family rRNA (Cytidine-2'-O)-methyltransferase n=1 Tax=Desulforhabdus amnigena TaxID=40218 RepID=A0A9W6CWE9_9BACT|nr:TlyA family RNA methyltransferase [Desulforhabdus amnigena]NLJ28876.1 TlyA family RNA methyltransferase [Deltaproteobacteria bacterium]GLI33106.1 TlyA family rRNA (cytidine-2'-O)-methyltransferase [Desulforhabdus amnigena]
MARSFVRLDKLLVDRGLTPSRERAQALILAAKVLVDGQKITKAGQKVPTDCRTQITGEDIPYVSRGGLKLEHALKAFEVDVQGLVAMDVGASTGGFTDCLLQNGAARVYAVDVGYGQLDWKLRQDSRVVVLERKNIRYLEKECIPEPLQLVTIDASFISLKLVIPAVLPFLAAGAQLIALIKPQFEAGREHIGKGGVVRDEAVRRQVCESIAQFCQNAGLQVKGITPSPILGPKGNQEFLLWAVYAGAPSSTE